MPQSYAALGMARYGSVSREALAGYPYSAELEEWHSWRKTRRASELRMLLMTYWDPIGVNGISEDICDLPQLSAKRIHSTQPHLEDFLE
jgi:hypothetical protein